MLSLKPEEYVELTQSTEWTNFSPDFPLHFLASVMLAQRMLLPHVTVLLINCC
jgi:hypothetical protein